MDSDPTEQEIPSAASPLAGDEAAPAEAAPAREVAAEEPAAADMMPEQPPEDGAADVDPAGAEPMGDEPPAAWGEDPPSEAAPGVTDEEASPAETPAAWGGVEPEVTLTAAEPPAADQPTAEWSAVQPEEPATGPAPDGGEPEESLAYAEGAPAIPPSWGREYTPDPPMRQEDLPAREPADALMRAYSPEPQPSRPEASAPVAFADQPTAEGPYPSRAYPSGYVVPAEARPAGRNRVFVIIGAAIGVFVIASLVLVFARGAFNRPQAGSRVLYQNALTGPANGWWNDKYKTSCYFKGDGYHIVSASNCYYSDADYTDADVSATAKLVSGDPGGAYGIAFRRPSKDNFYSFLITGGGDWLVLKGDTVLQKSTHNSAIKTGVGAVNRLEVRMRGGRFTFYANGATLGTLTDGAYSSGKVGLAGDQGLDVVFTDFTVTQG